MSCPISAIVDLQKHYPISRSFVRPIWKEESKKQNREAEEIVFAK
jgi:hypothetical protein